MRMSENEWEWVRMSENEWEWVRMNEDEYKVMCDIMWHKDI